MADDDRVRVEIGFEGGQVVGGFMGAAAVEELQRALHEDGPRVIVLDTEDGGLPRDRPEGRLFPALQPVEPRRLRHGLTRNRRRGRLTP